MVDITVFKGSKGGKIVESQTKKELGHDEVLIKVTHSGVCGTDEHYKHQDMVLGHEGAGIIEVSPPFLPTILSSLPIPILTTHPRTSAPQSRTTAKAIPSAGVSNKAPAVTANNA